MDSLREYWNQVGNSTEELHNNTKHQCGYSYCNICAIMRSINDKSVMAPLRNNNPNENHKKHIVFIFYDFETQQNLTLPGYPKTKIHVPNLCVTQHVWTQCQNEADMSKICTKCRVHE